MKYINIYLESVEQDVVTGNNTYTTTNGGHVNFTSSYNNINIVVDCRNKCIDFNVTWTKLLLRMIHFTEKWANILDEYLKNKLEVRVNTLINLALSKNRLTKRI
jgi:uncharacterized protein YpuA (DUF1002 family)